jgi:hypothetical protein
MRIVIFASELSALVGKNRYVLQGDALEKLVCRIVGMPTREQKIENSLSEKQRDIIYGAAGKCDLSQQVVDNVVEAKKKIYDLPDISREEKDELCNFAERVHFTSHGSKSEECIKKSVENQKSIQISKDDIFRKKHVFDINNHSVYIGGKCDGVAIFNSKETVVEIKNRIHRLFGTIPEYEKVQLYSYMYIYGIDSGLLIENYNSQKNMIPCIFDKNEWNIYMEELKKTISQINI